MFISATAFAQSDMSVQADAELKKYVNKVVLQVKSTDDPVEKRAILNESLDRLSGSLASVKTIASLTGEDKEFIDSFMNTLQEQQNELNGLEGFSKVQDPDLDDFADYMQQDIEQANRTITISLTSALLVALILVLIAT